MDVLAGSLPFGRGGVGSSGDLVGREPSMGGPAEHPGNDPAQGLGAAPVLRAVGDDGARAVAAHDIAVVGEAPVDGPDGVRVDAQGRAQLANRPEALAGLEATGLDPVGALPVDLCGEGEVEMALDVGFRTAPGAPRGPAIGDARAVRAEGVVWVHRT